MRYVVGFVFTPDRDRVVLIEKLRPAWQKGRLNGVGGKIEAGETPLDAMVREFEEETGVYIDPSSWVYNVAMRAPDWEVHFYSAVTELATAVESKTDEQVNLYPVPLLYSYPTISNLRWLVPLACDRHMVWPMHLEHG